MDLSFYSILLQTKDHGEDKRYYVEPSGRLVIKDEQEMEEAVDVETLDDDDDYSALFATVKTEPTGPNGENGAAPSEPDVVTLDSDDDMVLAALISESSERWPIEDDEVIVLD